MGCVCTTTLMAHTTAIIAKTRKSMTSMSGSQSHQKAGRQQVQHGHREKELPREAHQLVVAEARQRSANPHEAEKYPPRLGAKPEQRNQPALHHRQERRVGKECRSRWSPYH